jgi:hypothetical protein
MSGHFAPSHTGNGSGVRHLQENRWSSLDWPTGTRDSPPLSEDIARFLLSRRIPRDFFPLFLLNICAILRSR